MPIRYDIDWDDLRFFLIAAQSGTATSAASALRVSRTTVTRRVESLERSIGLPLYETSPFGPGSTDIGRLVLECARDLESRVDTLLKALQASALALNAIRISIPSELGIDIFNMYHFEAETPDATTIEIVQSALPEEELRERRSLLGICIADNLPAHLRGVHVTSLTQRPYVAPQYKPPAHGNPQWIGFGKELMHSTIARWISTNIADADIALRVNSGADLKEAVKRGLGIGYLWDKAASDLSLTQAEGFGPPLQSNLWICHHEDVPPTPSVRAIQQRLEQYLKAYYQN